VDACVLKPVLVLAVKLNAFIVEKRHDGRFPSWRPKEANNNVEKPFL
jgi:hypothetical protein